MTVPDLDRPPLSARMERSREHWRRDVALRVARVEACAELIPIVEGLEREHGRTLEDVTELLDLVDDELTRARVVTLLEQLAIPE